MVAPAEHNEKPVGTYGEALRFSRGVTFTRRELRALNRKAKYSSLSTVVRSLFRDGVLQQLIEETEAKAAAEASAAFGN